MLIFALGVNLLKMKELIRRSIVFSSSNYLHILSTALSMTGENKWVNEKNCMQRLSCSRLSQ